MQKLPWQLIEIRNNFEGKKAYSLTVLETYDSSKVIYYFTVKQYIIMIIPTHRNPVYFSAC